MRLSCTVIMRSTLRQGPRRTPPRSSARARKMPPGAPSNPAGPRLFAQLACVVSQASSRRSPAQPSSDRSPGTLLDHRLVFFCILASILSRRAFAASPGSSSLGAGGLTGGLALSGGEGDRLGDLTASSGRAALLLFSPRSSRSCPEDLGLFLAATSNMASICWFVNFCRPIK